MKILKHKKSLYNISNIMAAFAIMFISLFSFISSAFCLNNNSILTTTEKLNAISNYDTPIGETEAETAKQEVKDALEYVSITQTGIVLNENNFKQVTFTTITPSSEPEEDWEKNEGAKNIVYVVGAFTIWPQTIQTQTQPPETITIKSTIKVTKINPSTLVRSTAETPTAPETTTNTFGDNTQLDYKEYLAFAAPISSDSLYEISISYTTSTGGEPPVVTNHTKTFYVYQAPTINYENYGFTWQKHTNNADINISYPVENQMYDSGYADNHSSIDGYLTLKLDYNILKNRLNKNLNVLYIDFWHNGQAFSLRVENNGEGLDFYNNYNDSIGSFTIGSTSSKTADGKLDASLFVVDNIYTIKFNESGEYKVRIYDNTLNRMLITENDLITTATSLNGSPTSFTEGIKNNIYANANYIEHNFTIVNRAKLDGFYATAKTKNQDGEQIYIVNEIDRNAWRDEYRYMQQRTNKDVQVDFYNLNAINSITYSQYASVNSDVINKRVALDITSNTNHISNTITDEGDYYFDIEFKEAYNIVLSHTTKSGGSYSTITETYLANITYKTIGFQILKGVRDQYDFLHINNGTMTTKKYPEAADVLEINKVLIKNLNQDFAAYNSDTRSYIFFEGLGGQYLFGANNSAFTLNIAQSSPSISGIANNKSTTESVNLVFTGVATSEVGIKIAVYKDGRNIKNYTIFNQNPNEPLNYELSCTDLGSYKVVLTDAMQNSTEVRFAISQPKNAASIILIIVGVVLAAAVVFLIIKTRSKVSVR